MATIFELITIVPKILAVLGRTSFSALELPFRGEEGAPTAIEHVKVTALRTVFSYLTIRQLQLILPTWLSAYEAECKSRGQVPDVVNIPNTQATGFWLGNKEIATHTMVWYHSGGFAAPGSADLLELMKRIIGWSNNKLSIFCVSYTLTPRGVYPLQISEAVEALRCVLDTPGRSPERTILAGDSAGGNLVLAVLSHTGGHPHPRSDIVKPLQLSGKLYGATVIAPWVSSEVERFPSAKRFAGRDMVTPDIAQYWVEAYKGSKNVPDDEYIVPELAKPEWWSDVKVSSFLVTCGEQEILRDAVISWSQHFQEGAKDVDFKLVVGKSEIHCAPLFPKTEQDLTSSAETCQEAAIRNWFKSRLA